MEELLRMEHISKRFGDFYANHDVNLSVAKGEVHTLLGENGAGKSTLMNILIGLYQPTEGSIFLNGRQVRIESPSQAVKLGILDVLYCTCHIEWVGGSTCTCRLNFWSLILCRHIVTSCWSRR